MDSLRVRFRINYIALVGLLLLTGLAVAVYVITHRRNPDWAVALQVILNGVTLTCLVYTAMNYNLLANCSLETTRLHRCDCASRIIGQWYDPAMTSYTTLGRDLRVLIADKELAPDQIATCLAENRDYEVAMVAILNFLEHMAILICRGVADERILKDFFQVIVLQYYYAMREFIQKKRTRMGTEFLFNNLEALALRWEAHSHLPSEAEDVAASGTRTGG